MEHAPTTLLERDITETNRHLTDSLAFIEPVTSAQSIPRDTLNGIVTSREGDRYHEIERVSRTPGGVSSTSPRPNTDLLHQLAMQGQFALDETVYMHSDPDSITVRSNVADTSEGTIFNQFSARVSRGIDKSKLFGGSNFDIGSVLEVSFIADEAMLNDDYAPLKKAMGQFTSLLAEAFPGMDIVSLVHSGDSTVSEILRESGFVPAELYTQDAFVSDADNPIMIMSLLDPHKTKHAHSGHVPAGREDRLREISRRVELASGRYWNIGSNPENDSVISDAKGALLKRAGYDEAKGDILSSADSQHHHVSDRVTLGSEPWSACRTLQEMRPHWYDKSINNESYLAQEKNERASNPDLPQPKEERYPGIAKAGRDFVFYQSGRNIPEREDCTRLARGLLLNVSTAMMRGATQIALFREDAHHITEHDKVSIARYRKWMDSFYEYEGPGWMNPTGLAESQSSYTVDFGADRPESTLTTGLWGKIAARRLLNEITDRELKLHIRPAAIEEPKKGQPISLSQATITDTSYVDVVLSEEEMVEELPGELLSFLHSSILLHIPPHQRDTSGLLAPRRDRVAEALQKLDGSTGKRLHDLLDRTETIG